MDFDVFIGNLNAQRGAKFAYYAEIHEETKIKAKLQYLGDEIVGEIFINPFARVDVCQKLYKNLLKAYVYFLRSKILTYIEHSKCLYLYYFQLIRGISISVLWIPNFKVP